MYQLAPVAWKNVFNFQNNKTTRKGHNETHEELPRPLSQCPIHRCLVLPFYHSKCQPAGTPEGFRGVSACFCFNLERLFKFLRVCPWSHDFKCLAHVDHAAPDPLEENAILGAQLFVSLVPHHLQHSSVKNLPIKNAPFSSHPLLLLSHPFPVLQSSASP